MNAPGIVLTAILVSIITMLMAGEGLPDFLSGIGPVQIAPKK